MAAATLAEIREGLAAALFDAYGDTVQTNAYELLSLHPPTLHVVGIQRVMYDEAAASGLDEWTLTIQGLAGPTFDQGAQVTLDKWLDRGAMSVKNALEADRTLGGKVMDLAVTEAGSYRRIKLEDGTMLPSCEWTVRVLNRGA